MYIIHLVVLLLPGLFFLQVNSELAHQLWEGSKCNNTDSSGTCALVTNCPAAMKVLDEQDFHSFTRCGFVKDTEVVCCPLDLRQPKPGKPDDDEETEIRANQRARKSEKACKEYSKGLPVRLDFQIFGGKNASAGEFPHMAALGFYAVEDKTYAFVCGGTLISPDYVITAAHCLINAQNSTLEIVRLGVLNVPASIEKPDPTLDHNVINVTVHPDYNGREKLNDIALAKLGKKVTITDNIRPACLYTKNDDPIMLVVIGWGDLEFGGARSDILQQASVTPVGLRECNATYRSRTNRYITEDQLCAGGGAADACQGDSGGPLQTQNRTTMWTIVGVTSYGVNCGGRHPGIYTRVNSYLDWIEGIVWRGL